MRQWRVFAIASAIFLMMVPSTMSSQEGATASSRAGSLQIAWNHTHELSEATLWKLDWSHDGAMIAAVFFDSTCVVLDAADGSVVRTIDLSPERTRCDGFAPEGLMPLRDAAFSPDGRFLAVGGDDTDIHVFNTTTWEEEMTFAAHTGSVLCLEFSPDSRYLLSGSGTDKVIPQNAGENISRVWDMGTGDQFLELTGHKDGIIEARWSNAGDRIATVSDDRTVRVWSFPTGELLVDSAGHTSGVLDVAWSQDDSKLMTGSRDYKIKLWNSTTGENLATWPDYNCVRSVHIHPDGTVVATGGVDLTLKIRDIDTGTSLKILNEGVDQKAMVMSARWSPDGEMLASALGKSHTLVVYSFGREPEKEKEFPMAAVTIGAIALIFIVLLVILYIPAVKEIRRNRR